LTNEKPVFIQIIDMIKDDILSEVYAADDLIISIPQISKLLSVNPTTAQKAISLLVERGFLYKKRGVGMAVTIEAKDMILQERQDIFHKQIVPDFISAAKKIGIPNNSLMQIIKENLDD